MKITYESLCKFVQENGTAKFRDSEGKTKILKNGQADSFDLAEKANNFWFDGEWYTRMQFENFMDGKKIQ